MFMHIHPSMYMHTYTFAYVHAHTHTCAHTPYLTLYLKARPLVNIWNVLVFLFSSPQIQTFRVHHLFLYSCCFNASMRQEYFLFKKCMFWWTAITHLYSSVWTESHASLLLFGLGFSGVRWKGMMQLCLRIFLHVHCVCDREGKAPHWSVNVPHRLVWHFSYWGISSSSFISRADLQLVHFHSHSTCV